MYYCPFHKDYIYDWNYPGCEYDFREAEAFTKPQVDLMNLFRELWEQHGAWTRMAIQSLALDLEDTDLVVNRLLRNPSDFARALRPYYGGPASTRFGALLKDHLVIASELVKASKAGDNNAAAEAEKRWYENADEIALLLSRINPHWSRKDWEEMLHEHLALVKAEAVAFLTKNFSDSISVYDKIEDLALGMADVMSWGIIMQFPHLFRK